MTLCINRGEDMSKVLLGIILGIIVLAGFVYFGGAKYLRSLGTKTEEAGVKLEKVEKQLKESAKGAKKSAEKTAEKVKRYVPGN